MGFNIENKITKILMDELCYCYCDNCEFGNWDKYQDRECDGCHRKYQNWRLSENTARMIADKIIKIGHINAITEEQIKGALKKCKVI